MAYVAVTGGQEAIEASIQLLRAYRTDGEVPVELAALRERCKLLIDRMMAESGLYAPDSAALALKQSEGSPEEAVFLLRAYRSTLPRNYTSTLLDGLKMRVIRLISAAFKDIPGGQILGPTYDYTHRLLDFGLAAENEDETAAWRQTLQTITDGIDPFIPDSRVSDILRAEDLLEDVTPDNSEPFDVTLSKLPFPTPRSAILQTLARADAGFVSGLAYSSLRGYGAVHPTVGELRTGWLEVTIPYPLGDAAAAAGADGWGTEDRAGGDNEAEETQQAEIFVGEILITEVESFVHATKRRRQQPDLYKVGIGYGCVFGRNETKAISISILDRALRVGGDAPANDAEFVLMHGDCMEMNGFLSHLKLPHYVTFQSQLDQLRK